MKHRVLPLGVDGAVAEKKVADSLANVDLRAFRRIRTELCALPRLVSKIVVYLCQVEDSGYVKVLGW